MSQIYYGLMRLEVKTDERRFPKYFSEMFFVMATLFFGFLSLNFVFSLRMISRYYETKYLCNLILVDKSSTDFKKLGRIINRTNKQKLWEFCNVISK